MTRMLVILSLVCSGCVVLPATKTTVRPAGTETSAPAYGPVKRIALQTAASRSEVRVRAMATRECRRQVYAVTEVKKTKHARLGVDDPRGRALGVLLAPVTIPISAIITGIVVASADDETSRVTRPLRVDTEDCTGDGAGVAIELQFPSGQIRRGTTDRNGVLVAAIPAEEPYSGNVEVRAGAVTAPVHYEQVVPPVTIARDAIETCRAQHQLGSVTLRLAVNDRGLATRMWLSDGDRAFHSCVSRRLTGVVFPVALRNRTVVLPIDVPAT